MNNPARPSKADTRSAAEAASVAGDRLRAAVEGVWPARTPRRPIGGLPAIAAGALIPGRLRRRFERAASQLDRAVPGWPEQAARVIGEAADGGMVAEHRRACALLAQRPVHRPEMLLRAARGARDPVQRMWLLVALTGTDTPALRSDWLERLRRSASVRAAPDCALWYGFLRAFLGGWLSYAEFRGCLAEGRVLGAAAANGDYRPALKRLGLSSDPLFGKWYRQIVYELCNEPDVWLELRAGGWIREFPGEAYFWDALSAVDRRPDSWWPLHVLRWASGVVVDDPTVAQELSRFSPVALSMLSLVRPDLTPAVERALGVSQHEKAVRWLKSAASGRPFPFAWVEQVLGSWAHAIGKEFTEAAGALASVEPPPDFPAPDEAALRRREFVMRYLVPEIDRLMDNLAFVHVLRRRHFDAVCRQARLGRPSAARALGLWSERAQDAGPLLFRLTREGTRGCRRAAREALDSLRRRVNADDLGDLERRLDLAAAWADGGLEGKAARVWWDVGGYRVRIAVVSGAVRLQVYSEAGPLKAVPRKVRQSPEYDEIKRARDELARSYWYFRRRFEQAMLEQTQWAARDFTVLLANPVVRSLVSRLLISLDGQPFLWTPEDPLTDARPPEELAAASSIGFAHPLDLERREALSSWQQHTIDERVAQPFKQVFREVYVVDDEEREECECGRFAEHPLVARRVFALLRARGYSPGRGVATREWDIHSLRAHIRWAGEDENAGKLLAQTDAAEFVTSGPVWFERESGERIPLREVPPILLSETLRDADLLVSRAAAGEMGFSSEETRQLRATLVRYLCRALGLTTVYVGERATHALVEGRRAMYRVHLGSGTVLLEHTRRHLDTRSLTNQRVGDLVAEGMDTLTTRILEVIVALSQDHTVQDPAFLRQLPGGRAARDVKA